MKHQYVLQASQFANYLLRHDVFDKSHQDQMMDFLVRVIEDKCINRQYLPAVRDMLDLQNNGDFATVKERILATATTIFLNSKPDEAAKIMISSFADAQDDRFQLDKGQRLISKFLFQGFYETKQ